MTKEELVKDSIIEKDALSVVEILEKKHPKHDFDWKRQGKILIGHCPRSEKHAHGDANPSLKILPNKNGNGWHWYCFACQYSGPKPADISPLESDIAIFREHLQEKLMHGFDNTFLDYMQKRIPKIGEEIGFDSLFSLEIGAYSKEITEKLSKNEDKNEDKDINVREKIEKWGMAQYEWLVFVYRDVNGKPVFVKFRNISIPKYNPRWHDVGTKTIKLTKNTAEIGFFGDGLRSQAPILFLLEGEFDAITTTLVMGWKCSALAMSGTSGFKKEAIEQIVRKVNVKDKPRKAIFVQPDWDDAGRLAIEKLVNSADIEFLRKNDIRTIPNSPVGDIKDMDELLKGNYDDASSIMSDLLKKENTVPLAKIKEEREKREKEEQEKMFNDLPPVIREMAGVEVNGIKKFITADNVMMRQYEKEEPVFKSFYRGVNILAGDSGVGKSYTLLRLALEYTQKAKQKALLIFYEDEESEFFQKRLKFAIENYCSEYGVQEKNLDLTLLDITFYYPPIFSKEYGKLKKNKYWDEFKEDIEFHGLVCIDPLLSFVGVTELDSSLLRNALIEIKNLISGKQKYLIFSHHITKNSESVAEITKKENLQMKDIAKLRELIRGSGEIVNVARNVIFTLPSVASKNVVNLVTVKSNVAPVNVVKKVILPWSRYEDYNNEHKKQSSSNDNIHTFKTQNLNVITEEAL